MKKIISIFLTAIMLFSCAIIFPVSADTNTDTTETYVAPIYYGAQSGIGTNANTNKLRFISLVPENKGTVLGYEIVVTYDDKVVRYSAADGDDAMESSVVYASLLANTDYGTEKVTVEAVAEELGVGTGYGLFVVVIDNIPVNAQFDVRTYVKEDADEPEDKSGCTSVTWIDGAIGTAIPTKAWATQGGNGTTAYPYVLNQKNFVAFYNDNMATGQWTYRDIGHCVLESDVVINEGNASEWAESSPATVWAMPIGNVTGGSFDGNGHTIFGICMKLNTSYTCRAGLFSELHENVVVKNLTIENSYFTDVSNTSTYVGSIAGYANNANINNCHSNAIVDIPSRSNYYIGGIVGYQTGTTTVSNCTFGGKVTTTVATNNLGGIAGALNGGTITECYSYGSILGGATDNNVGGIVGIVPKNANVSVSNCVFNGTVSSGGAREGGIVGGFPSWAGATVTITNCLNLGSVSSTNNGMSGGIFGYSDAGTQNISNCINLSTNITTANNKVKNDISNGTGTINVTSCYTVEGYCIGSTVNGLTKLDSIDALNNLNLEGWYYVDGYLPSPIEGLLFQIDFNQYNSYIGKGLELTSTYELIEGLSTQETVVVDGMSFPWAQGGCTDGTYYYCFMITNEDIYDPAYVVVLKYDLATQTLVGQSDVYLWGHSNDAAYNPHNNTIVLINGGEGHIVLDAETLTRIGTFTAAFSSGTVAYDPTKRIYMIGDSDTMSYYDDNYNLIKTVDFDGMYDDFNQTWWSKWGHQGMTSDGKYIYILENWINSLNKKDQRCNIVVYDIDTLEFVERIPLHMGREVEHIFIWNNSFYITCNNLDWDGAECYKIDVIPKT